jgi:hypothetical protein
MIALALHFQEEISRGRLKNHSDIARLGKVTTARVSQIMNHLHLAPDIMEEILFLPRVTKGRDPIPERALRRILDKPNWQHQRIRWRKLKQRAGYS